MDERLPIEEGGRAVVGRTAGQRRRLVSQLSTGVDWVQDKEAVKSHLSSRAGVFPSASRTCIKPGRKVPHLDRIVPRKAFEADN